MANQDQTHALLYGLDIFSSHQGVLNWTNYTIIKKDCGKDSKMSQTQKTRKKVDKTFPIAIQYKLISSTSHTVIIFHVEKNNIQPPPSFIFVGKIKLQENIHTASSRSNSIEYMSFYSKPEYYPRIQQRFDELENYYSFTREARNVDEKFVKSLLSRPECLSVKNVLTDNQSKIAKHFHTHYKYPSLININASVSFATGNRRPNGKIQSMSGPAIIYNSHTYKLSTKGRYFFRGIPYSSSSTINFIRHSVHPEYIRVIHQYFS
jgi:hypothetical protein